MKLYELPRSDKGIKIVADGISDGSKYLLFYHIDGMYSYCKTEKGGTIHLSASTPIKKVGTHYEIDTMQAPEKKCLRCLHKWVPRVPDPKRCPECNSPYWNKPRQKRHNHAK